MELTIEQIQEQISNLQKLVDDMKSPKLEIGRFFTGQYFKPYRNIQYRRMESEGISIWEYYNTTKREWIVLPKTEVKELEALYNRDCITVEQPISDQIDLE